MFKSVWARKSHGQVKHSFEWIGFNFCNLAAISVVCKTLGRYFLFSVLFWCIGVMVVLVVLMCMLSAIVGTFTSMGYRIKCLASHVIWFVETSTAPFFRRLLNVTIHFRSNHRACCCVLIQLNHSRKFMNNKNNKTVTAKVRTTPPTAVTTAPQPATIVVLYNNSHYGWFHAPCWLFAYFLFNGCKYGTHFARLKHINPLNYVNVT